MQVHLKSLIIAMGLVIGLTACLDSDRSARYYISESKSYEASLYRQNCAVCHGPEAQGKLLDDGTEIPNLREGDIKFKTDADIAKHITDGGNGMTPFRDQLTEREIKLLVDLVQRDLRQDTTKAR